MLLLSRTLYHPDTGEFSISVPLPPPPLTFQPSPKAVLEVAPEFSKKVVLSGLWHLSIQEP